MKYLDDMEKIRVFYNSRYIYAIVPSNFGIEGFGNRLYRALPGERLEPIGDTIAGIMVELLSEEISTAFWES